MEFETAVKRRRMVRNYTDEPVEPAKLDRIMDMARRAPSAGFSQGQSFVVVTDPAIRKRIAEIAGEPDYVAMGFDPWVSRAPVLVLVCTSEKIYKDRYSEPDKKGAVEGEWPVPYWWVDGGCSMMLLLLASVDEGLVSGFLGLPDYSPLKELLGIPEHVSPIGIVTIGHPAPDRRSPSLGRGWKAPESVVHRERWS